jgi:serine/threonine protein kinase
MHAMSITSVSSRKSTEKPDSRKLINLPWSDTESNKIELSFKLSPASLKNISKNNFKEFNEKTPAEIIKETIETIETPKELEEGDEIYKEKEEKEEKGEKEIDIHSEEVFEHLGGWSGQLGEGAYGKVFASTNNKGYVVKSIYLGDISTWTREILASQLINSKYVIKISAVQKTRNYVMLYMRQYEPLRKFINRVKKSKNRSAFSKICLEIAYKVLIGISDMHRMGVCHRDLKVDNILVDYDEYGNLRPVICDLGMAGCNFDKIIMKSNFVTTETHRAPEIQLEKDPGNYYSVDCDIWAFAVLVFEMIITGCGMRHKLSCVSNDNSRVADDVSNKVANIIRNANPTGLGEKFEFERFDFLIELCITPTNKRACADELVLVFAEKFGNPQKDPKINSFTELVKEVGSLRRPYTLSNKIPRKTLLNTKIKIDSKLIDLYEKEIGGIYKNLNKATLIMFEHLCESFDKQNIPICDDRKAAIFAISMCCCTDIDLYETVGGVYTSTPEHMFLIIPNYVGYLGCLLDIIPTEEFSNMIY